MYVLILLTCQGLACMQFEVLAKYPSLSSCEAAMEERYDQLADGQGLMCIRTTDGELTT